MDTQDRAGSSMNDSGTGKQIDPSLTQPCSGFDLEDTRRDLIALRVRHGAESPIGHRCSNLIEQLEHYRTAEGDQRTNLAKSIQKSMAELS